MNKVIKINDLNTNVFFGSDFHTGHNKEFLWGKRGFKNVEEHNEWIISGINSKIKENDILVHCGDFCLNTSVEELDNILDKINCQNILCLWGNHPNPLLRLYKEYRGYFLSEVLDFEIKPGLSVKREVYPLRYRNIVFLGDYQEFIIRNKFIVVTHYPIESWNRMSHNSWQISGHSHASDPNYKPSVTEFGKK